MTHEKFTAGDVANLMVQCQWAIERCFTNDPDFSADVTDITGHFNEDTGLEEISLKVKFNKIG